MASHPAAAIEDQYGHPGDKRDALIDKIDTLRFRDFQAVQWDWLDLMWTLDQYRIAGVAPRDMGDSKNKGEQLPAVYRQKGGWFAQVLAALLENQTRERVAPTTKVRGFSQLHQIDLAYPDRRDLPLICAETKVTGAPAYGSYPERGAMSDFSNRRKELKFAATDLKLARRDLKTEIKHWGHWKENATPRTYFLWAARLRRGVPKQTKKGVSYSGRDEITRLVKEASLLVDTYLDGAGLVAWQLNDEGTGYEVVEVPLEGQARTLDDALLRIGNGIDDLAKSEAKLPPPVEPEDRAVSPEALPDDKPKD